MRAKSFFVYGKTIGITLAVAGLLTLAWSDGYLLPGLLVLAGLLVYFVLPRALVGWWTERVVTFCRERMSSAAKVTTG